MAKVTKSADETLRESDRKRRKLDPPSRNGGAYYPPASQSPRRQLESAQIAKHIGVCQTCDLPLDFLGCCKNPECPEFGGMRTPQNSDEGDECGDG